MSTPERLWTPTIDLEPCRQRCATADYFELPGSLLPELTTCCTAGAVGDSRPASIHLRFVLWGKSFRNSGISLYCTTEALGGIAERNVFFIGVGVSNSKRFCRKRNFL